MKLSHIQPYVDDDQSKRKRKSTDFLHDQHMVKQKKGKKQENEVICLDDDDDVNKIVTKTPFYSRDNSSKLCAEGALKNMLHLLQMKKEDIDCFWVLATSPVSAISDFMNSNIPKAVCNSHQQVNAIQNSFGFYVNISSLQQQPKLS